MDNKGFKILLPEYKIQRKAWEIAQKISEKHRGQLPPVMVCVLNGGFMFFTELVKSMDIDVEIDFIRAKSYDMNNEQGSFKIIKDIELDIKGKSVYIVDDILETGTTMKELYLHITQKLPTEIYTVTLLKRKSCDHPLDYFGFEIEDKNWVYGAGLDDSGLRRNYRNIYYYE
jgi:hypoxanthine phosphoribosyltransferase